MLLPASAMTFLRDGKAWMSYNRDAAPETSNEQVALHGEKQLNYFIGSGHRGRTYLYQENGQWFEAPINYYGKRHLWDMAPNYGASRTMPAALPVDSKAVHTYLSSTLLLSVSGKADSSHRNTPRGGSRSGTESESFERERAKGYSALGLFCVPKRRYDEGGGSWFGAERADIRKAKKGALVRQRDESVLHPLAERVHRCNGNQWRQSCDRIGRVGRCIGVGTSGRGFPSRCHSNPYDGDRRTGFSY